MARALFFVGLVCLAFTAAGAASVETEAEDAVQGRQLLTGGWGWVPTYSQSAGQVSGNIAKNSWPGPGTTANQQSSNQLVQQQGNNNQAQNGNWQSIDTAPQPPAKKGDRKLLSSGGQWVWFDQSAFQLSGNVAKNTGTANQQSSNQLVQQQGNWNTGFNQNSQSIDTAPQPPAKKGDRKLLSSGGQWVWFDQSAFQLSGNVAKNTGTANQQSSNQLVQQQGNNNQAQNGNWQSINTAPQPPAKKGDRKLLSSGGQWVWFDQSAFQASGNFAKNVGAANQQSSNQLVQQQGNGNWAGNSNSQSITTAPDAKKGP